MRGYADRKTYLVATNATFAWDFRVIALIDLVILFYVDGVCVCVWDLSVSDLLRDRVFEADLYMLIDVFRKRGNDKILYCV